MKHLLLLAVTAALTTSALAAEDTVLVRNISDSCSCTVPFTKDNPIITCTKKPTYSTITMGVQFENASPDQPLFEPRFDLSPGESNQAPLSDVWGISDKLEPGIACRFSTSNLSSSASLTDLRNPKSIVLLSANIEYEKGRFIDSVLPMNSEWINTSTCVAKTDFPTPRPSFLSGMR